jgi:hypothetical protein
MFSLLPSERGSLRWFEVRSRYLAEEPAGLPPANGRETRIRDMTSLGVVILRQRLSQAKMP